MNTIKLTLDTHVSMVPRMWKYVSKFLNTSLGRNGKEKVLKNTTYPCSIVTAYDF